MTAPPATLRIFSFFAAAAVLGVVTAQLLLPELPPASTVADRVGLYVHPVFRARTWIILLQVFAMFLALWGLALGAWKRAPVWIWTGFLFFVFWQLFELIPRSVELFAESYRWAPAFVASGDETERAAIVTAFRRTGAVLDALAHPRRAFWALGHLLFGMAFVRGSRLEKAMAALFLFNAFRLLIRMAGEAAGIDGLASALSGRWPFVAGMVLLFGLIAWWLWTAAAQTPVPAAASSAPDSAAK